MNILIFSWRDIKHPKAGGAEQVMHEHAKGWVKAGHKVTHFSSKINTLPAYQIIDEIEFVRGGYQYLGVVIAGFFYFLKNRDKFDLVVDEFHGIPFFTPIFVRKPKIAVIQEIAKNVWFLNPLPKPINWIVGTIGYLLEPLVFQLYKKTCFITGSQSAKEDVIKYGISGDLITIIPHGVILTKPKRLPPKEKFPTVTFLGVLSKDKGIEDALKCFSQLDKKGHFQFWIIGRAETEKYGAKILKITNQLNFQSKVKFWGFVSQEKKFELLSKTHLLINSSIHEGWGLVNIEANSVGTPVVAFKSAGLIDSIEEGVSGIFSKEKNPKSLAETIYNLLTDRAYLAKMNKTSVVWSKQFSWEKAKKQSLKLIEKAAI